MSRYQKGNTNLDLLKQETVSGSGISWTICKSAPRSRQITTPAPHRSGFLQAGCPSCRPTNSVKALKAVLQNTAFNFCSNNSRTGQLSVPHYTLDQSSVSAALDFEQRNLHLSSPPQKLLDIVRKFVSKWQPTSLRGRIRATTCIHFVV